MDSQTLLIIFLLLNQAFCKTALRNVAYNKPTDQSSSPQAGGDSNHAVDNNTDSVFNHRSCTHTGFSAIEWWCVDLQHVYIINNIELYNSGILQGRLRGFTMKLSNTGPCNGAGFNSASPCYTDHSQQNHSVYNITQCNQPSSTSLSGRFVFIQNRPHQALTLCEVQIYKGGCPNGTFGEDCEKQCNIKCKDRLCNSTTGTCNTCIQGYYGTTCQYKCSDGCTNNNCNKDGGYCTCKSGFTGDRCENCQQGKYGGDCQQNCSIGCKDHTCSRSDGTCNVCTPGWFDLRCDSPCVITNCIGNCNKITGQCSTCHGGFYGTNCRSKCSSNCTGACDKSNGTCNDCKPDTVGPYCNSTCGSGCQPITGNITCNRHGRCTRCIMGRYGDRCNKNCNYACNGGCDRYNGTCINGCIKGKSGEHCDKNCNDNCIHCKQDNINSCTECKDGRWGTSCHEICSFNCKPRNLESSTSCNSTSSEQCRKSSCDQMTGNCSLGCIAGKKGNYCTEICSAGYYGDNCANTCGRCARGTPCNTTSGSCGPVGCEDGFIGQTCQQDKSEQSKPEGISPVVGGIIGALFGIAVTSLICITGFCYYIKRKSLPHAAREPPGYRYNNRPDTCVSPVVTAENTYDALEQASTDNNDVADSYYQTLAQVPEYVNLGRQ